MENGNQKKIQKNCNIWSHKVLQYYVIKHKNQVTIYVPQMYVKLWKKRFGLWKHAHR